MHFNFYFQCPPNVTETIHQQHIREILGAAQLLRGASVSLSREKFYDGATKLYEYRATIDLSKVTLSESLMLPLLQGLADKVAKAGGIPLEFKFGNNEPLKGAEFRCSYLESSKHYLVNLLFRNYVVDSKNDSEKNMNPTEYLRQKLTFTYQRFSELGEEVKERLNIAEKVNVSPTEHGLQVEVPLSQPHQLRQISEYARGLQWSTSALQNMSFAVTKFPKITLLKKEFAHVKPASEVQVSLTAPVPVRSTLVQLSLMNKDAQDIQQNASQPNQNMDVTTNNEQSMYEQLRTLKFQ